ncbi:MAG TPA: hypothetical protein VJ927_00155 [Actinomycetota bacterium]|nr:hypothetical protein [Actinomycetota bacterium]
MTTGLIAALVATLALGFVEGMRRFYPSRQTWRRLRRTRGRLAVRLMRERFEAAAERGSPRVLAEVLAGLVIVWIAIASLLDKRWYEVVTDVLPYVFVGIALFRLPGALRAIAERMKVYEREVGEDPDEDWREGGDGPAVLAL